MSNEQIAFEREFKRPESVDFKGGEYIVNEKLHVRANSWFEAQIFIAQWKAWRAARYAGGGEAVEALNALKEIRKLLDGWQVDLTCVAESMEIIDAALKDHPAPAVPDKEGSHE